LLFGGSSKEGVRGKRGLGRSEKGDARQHSHRSHGDNIIGVRKGEVLPITRRENTTTERGGVMGGRENYLTMRKKTK